MQLRRWASRTGSSTTALSLVMRLAVVWLTACTVDWQSLLPSGTTRFRSSSSSSSSIATSSSAIPPLWVVRAFSCGGRRKRSVSPRSRGFARVSFSSSLTSSLIRVGLTGSVLPEQPLSPLPPQPVTSPPPPTTTTTPERSSQSRRDENILSPDTNGTNGSHPRPHDKNNNGDNDDEPPNFDLQLGRALDTLRRDYPLLLTTPPDFSIYHRHVEVVDPSGVKVHGLKAYKNTFRILQAIIKVIYCPSRSNLTFRMCYDKARHNIRIHWNAKVIPRTIFGGSHTALHVDGISVYELDQRTGAIVQHRIEQLLMNDTPILPEEGVFVALQNHHTVTVPSFYRHHHDCQLATSSSPSPSYPIGANNIIVPYRTSFSFSGERLPATSKLSLFSMEAATSSEEEGAAAAAAAVTSSNTVEDVSAVAVTNIHTNSRSGSSTNTSSKNNSNTGNNTSHQKRNITNKKALTSAATSTSSTITNAVSNNVGPTPMTTTTTDPIATTTVSTTGTTSSESNLSSSPAQWEEALQQRNKSRQKFGLKPLTLEEFKLLQIQVQEMERQQKQQFQLQQQQRKEEAEAEQKRRNGSQNSFFQKLLGNAASLAKDTCETNFDCERPEICCDFGFVKKCCSGGSLVGASQPVLRPVPVPVPVELPPNTTPRRNYMV